MNRTCVVLWRGDPLVVITNTEYQTLSEIKQWYCEKYAFYPTDISVDFVDSVIMENNRSKARVEI